MRWRARSTIARLVAVQVVALLTLASCQPKTPEVALAWRVAEDFVAADTAGRFQTADSLVNWAACDYDPAQDFVQVTAEARVTNARVRGDTVDVTVKYEVLGRAWSYGEKLGGPQSWRFVGERRVDTLVLHILPAETPPIACGEYHMNHVALSAMDWAIAHMDDASRSALEKARSARD